MTTDDLAGLLAEHGSWRWTCDSDGFPTCDFGILCDCGKFIEASQETDGGARLRHGEHVAAVIRAAGWRKGREEWGVRYPEAINSGYKSEVQAHLDATHWNGTIVRRYVTDWEEAE